MSRMKGEAAMSERSMEGFFYADFAGSLWCGSGGDNSAVRARYARFARSAVRCLPKRQRSVVELYFFKGKSRSATARQLGIHPSTVSRRLAAARRTMQDMAAVCMDAGLFLA